MKEINEKIAKKALRNLKSFRRYKVLCVVIGLVSWGFAVFWGWFLYRYVQDPWPYESTAEVAFQVCFFTVKVALLVLMGTLMLCVGLTKDYKDILLEYVAEEILKKKEKEK